MDKRKYIIGRGETLIKPITIKSGGGDNKLRPYTFSEAADRLMPQIDRALREIDALPDAACPGDESVIALTLHPTFLAKSYHPGALLAALGLRQVGSRERRDVEPMTRVGKSKRSAMPTSELFVAGMRADLHRLRPDIVAEKTMAIKNEFSQIEQINTSARQRLRVAEPSEKNAVIPVEIVLHAGTNDEEAKRIGDAFISWCALFGEEVVVKGLRYVGGLGFVNAYASGASIAELSRFSFIRVMRQMPRLALRSLAVRAEAIGESFDVIMPSGGPLSEQVRVAVFDGGLPPDHPFGASARGLEPAVIGPPIPEHQAHAMQVTSAVLFGHIDEGQDPYRPPVGVDVWRVTDADIGPEFELAAALAHIKNILSDNKYVGISLSIGPDEAMVDDDIDEWTAMMDQLAADGNLLIVSAAGNNGDYDATTHQNRIQPSADGVNVLAVGARDTVETEWSKARYSAIGPGRSPGRVKPDVMAFGGEEYEPFFAISAHGVASATMGTSFAAPSTLRLAGGLKAAFSELSPTAIRALLVHTSNPSVNTQIEVGYGSVRHDLEALMLCAEDEATVIYQGVLSDERYMQCPLPYPIGGFARKVEITATLVIASQVEPQDSVTYTRSGVGAFFRPNTVIDPGRTSKGELRSHPSAPFLTAANVTHASESALRDDAHKWDTVMKATRKFNSGTLANPVFDVEHLMRSNGGQGVRPADVAFSLIISLREKGRVDLHEQVLAAHPSLQALEPQIDLPASR